MGICWYERQTNRRYHIREFENREALIVGGTSGMGRAVAERLLDGGARVLALPRGRCVLMDAAELARRNISKRPPPAPSVVGIAVATTSLEETAEVVGVSLATVKRELRFARAWLAAELGAGLPSE